MLNSQDHRRTLIKTSNSAERWWVGGVGGGLFLSLNFRKPFMSREITKAIRKMFTLPTIAWVKVWFTMRKFGFVEDKVVSPPRQDTHTHTKDEETTTTATSTPSQNRRFLVLVRHDILICCAV